MGWTKRRDKLDIHVTLPRLYKMYKDKDVRVTLKRCGKLKKKKQTQVPTLLPAPRHPR